MTVVLAVTLEEERVRHRFTVSHAMKRSVMIFAVLALLEACQSAPSPGEMARTTTDTAPADLQLLCADAAARGAQIDASKILPVSSAKLDDQHYSVQLAANGKPLTCTVDVNGTVKSVTHPT